MMKVETSMSRIGRRVVTAALLATASTASMATQVANSSLFVMGSGGSTLFNDSHTVTSSGTDTATSRLTPSITYVTPNVFAVAQPGTLKAFTHADSSIPNDGSVNSLRRTQASSASARWTTNATVTAPGVAAGLSGSGTATIAFNGSFSYDATGTVGYYLGTGYAYQRLSVGGSTGSINYDSRYQLTDGNGYFDVQRSGTGPAGGLIVHDTSPGAAGGYGFNNTLEVNFTFTTGQAVAIDASLSVFGRSLSSGGGSGVDWIVNAGNSAYWLGLSDVVIDGVAVNNFSFIDTTTGVDLSGATAVPIPASAGLFASGLSLLLGLVARRRRSGAVA